MPFLFVSTFNIVLLMNKKLNSTDKNKPQDIF